MRIGEVADRAGVKTSLIRYYEEIGLLPEPERVSGQRRYDQSVLRRLAVATHKLPEIDALIDRAQRVRAWLETATGCDCRTIDECALFDEAASSLGAA